MELLLINQLRDDELHGSLTRRKKRKEKEIESKLSSSNATFLGLLLGEHHLSPL